MMLRGSRWGEKDLQQSFHIRVRLSHENTVIPRVLDIGNFGTLGEARFSAGAGLSVDTRPFPAGAFLCVLTHRCFFFSVYYKFILYFSRHSAAGAGLDGLVSPGQTTITRTSLIVWMAPTGAHCVVQGPFYVF